MNTKTCFLILIANTKVFLAGSFLLGYNNGRKLETAEEEQAHADVF
jgi:hypothetical protein